MKPESRVQDRIDEVGRRLAGGLGTRALCIAVYGSAAGEEFSPRHSDVNLLLVLREVAFPDLRLIGSFLERESSAELRFATPIVVRPEFLSGARDSFPIELDDMRRRHRVIFGEDPFLEMRVSPGALRLAAERDARTLSLRIHTLGLHRPPDRELQAALASLAASAGVIAWALVGSPEDGVGHGTAKAFQVLSERTGVSLSGLLRLVAIRDAARPWPVAEELDQLLATLLGELDLLASAIDARRL